MKKILTILLLMLMTTASAEQIVTINILPTPTPRPVYRPSDDLPDYDLDEKEVKILARLLWSSPLYSESEKTNLLWVVFNRCDQGYPFGTTIEEVVNDREFTFYDRKARISDKNRDIAERELTRWLAEKNGYHIGRRPPKDAVYCRFVGEYNRKIELTKDPYEKGVEW